jgi:hypothetical protein
MGSNIVDRDGTQEFGVLHPKAVRRVVIAEGILLALTSCLVTVIPGAGLYLHRKIGLVWICLARRVGSGGEDGLDGTGEVVLAQRGRCVLDGGHGRGDRLRTQAARAHEREYLRDHGARVHPRDVHGDVVPV